MCKEQLANELMVECGISYAAALICAAEELEIQANWYPKEFDSKVQEEENYVPNYNELWWEQEYPDTTIPKKGDQLELDVTVDQGIPF